MSLGRRRFKGARPRSHSSGVESRLISGTGPRLPGDTTDFWSILGIVLLILESTHFLGVKGHDLWSSLGGVWELLLGTVGFHLLEIMLAELLSRLMTGLSLCERGGGDAIPTFRDLMLQAVFYVTSSVCVISGVSHWGCFERSCRTPAGALVCSPQCNCSKTSVSPPLILPVYIALNRGGLCMRVGWLAREG